MDKKTVKNVEVLVSTIDRSPDDFYILEKMNIQGNVIVCNQYDKYHAVSKKMGESTQAILTFPNRGIGRSRNTLLLQSEAKFCVLADDDMVFYEQYEKTVEEVFAKNGNPDVVIFNLEDGYVGNKTKNTIEINYGNYKKYGAARIAFQRQSIIDQGIFFSLEFGASKFGSGEDTLFLQSCLKANLRIIAVPDTVAKLEDSRESTWFSGYNEKYYFDKGALYYALNKYMFHVNALQFSLRKSKLSKGEISSLQAFKLMCNGKKAFKNNYTYSEYKLRGREKC